MAMALPVQKDIELPLLLEIEAMGGEARPQDLYPRVTAHFPQITEADLKETLAGGTSKWTNGIRWTRESLVLKGQLGRHPRGVWRITEKGRERLRREGLLEERPVAVEAPKAIREEAAPPLVRVEKGHEQVETQIQEIGKILGKYAKKEYHEAPYTYDVIWKDMEWLRRVTHAFEIQDKGNLIEALAKLKHAHDNWGSRLFLIVTEEKDRRKSEQLLEPHFMGTFHEIGAVTTVLSPEDVDELHKFLSRFREVIERFLAK